MAGTARELSLNTIRVAYDVLRQVPAGNAQQAVKLANALVELEEYIAAVYPEAVSTSPDATNT